MAGIPGVLYQWDGTTQQFKAKGRPNLNAGDRTYLRNLYGQYVPDASTTGPLGALTPIYVSQAGVASTNSANGYGGIWVVSSSMPAQTVLINGVPRQMRVLDGLDIHGMVDLRVPTLVRNCKTRSRAGGTKVANQWWSGISVVNPGAAGSYIVDCELTVDEPTELHIAGVNGGAGVTIERTNIHGGVDGIRFGDINSGCNANDLLGSWVHDLEFINGPFAPQPEGPHCDDVQYGPNIAYNGLQRIVGSYLNARISGHPVNTTNNGPSCIMIPGSTDTAFNLQVIQSWLEWGWFPLNSGGTPANGSTILLDRVKGRPGWFTRNGTTYHEVSTSAWNTATTRIDCADWDTGGSWRRTA